MKKLFLSCLSVCGLVSLTFGQSIYQGNAFRVPIGATQWRTIQLDSRTISTQGAMATSPDAYAISTNVAKMAFADDSTRNTVAMAFVPYNRNLIDDQNLYGANFTRKISKTESWGVALSYFQRGASELMDANANSLGTVTSGDFNVKAGYAKRLSQHFSLGVAFAYTYSNPFQMAALNGMSVKAAQAFSADMYAYHSGNTLKNTWLSWGLGVSNIGGKMSYGDTKVFSFQPQQFWSSVGLHRRLSASHQLSFYLSANKMLVPTPKADGSHQNVSALGALLSSWGDAPNGIKEELQEIAWGGGLEYSYRNLLFARGAVHYEHPNKGNLTFATLGLGVKQINLSSNLHLSLDMAYLLSLANSNNSVSGLRMSAYLSF
jgi:Type IX secretion system protein PorV